MAPAGPRALPGCHEEGSLRPEPARRQSTRPSAAKRDQQKFSFVAHLNAPPLKKKTHQHFGGGGAQLAAHRLSHGSLGGEPGSVEGERLTLSMHDRALAAAPSASCRPTARAPGAGTDVGSPSQGEQRLLGRAMIPRAFPHGPSHDGPGAPASRTPAAGPGVPSVAVAPPHHRLTLGRQQHQNKVSTQDSTALRKKKRPKPFCRTTL